MIHHLLHTTNDYTILLLRLTAGIIIFPYGMQKLFGWFEDLGGGVGIKESLMHLQGRGIPLGLAWLVIIGQSIGSLGLILGFLTRIAAGANIVIFIGALFVHSKDGWTMNWTLKKKGEGIEYFVILLSILTFILIRGAGAVSIDQFIIDY